MSPIDPTSSRSAIFGSWAISFVSRVRSASASAVENVVRSTRASGCVRARWTARCSATMVLPVPAEPDTRAGPWKLRLTICRCAGCRKTVHFSHGYSKGPLQLLVVGHDAETALRVRMGKRILIRGRGRRRFRRAAGGKRHQSFGGLGGEVIGDLQEGIFVVHLPDFFQPLGGNAVVQQLVVRHSREER